MNDRGTSLWKVTDRDEQVVMETTPELHLQPEKFRWLQDRDRLLLPTNMRRVCFFPAHSSFFSSHSTDRSSLCVIVNNGFRGSRAPEMPQRFVISSCIENCCPTPFTTRYNSGTRNKRRNIYIYYKGTSPCLRLYGEAHFRNYVCSLDGFTCTEMPELDGSKHPVFGI